MGVETVFDVEESTEPPICGYKDPTTNVKSHCATEEKSISHAKGNPAPLGQPDKDSLDRNAHLIEPSEIASVLQTDLQCVFQNALSISFLTQSSEMACQAQKRRPASSAMVRIPCVRWRVSPSGGYC
jgi:hypothetical protein